MCVLLIHINIRLPNYFIPFSIGKLQAMHSLETTNTE